MAYDNAGNLSWSASGQALPSTTACDTASVAAGQKVGRSYDGRNRLLTLAFPDDQKGVRFIYGLELRRQQQRGLDHRPHQRRAADPEHDLRQPGPPADGGLAAVPRQKRGWIHFHKAPFAARPHRPSARHVAGKCT